MDMCAYTAYICSSPGKFPTDPVGIIALSAAEEARQACDSAVMVLLHMQICCQQEKTLKYGIELETLQKVPF